PSPTRSRKSAVAIIVGSGIAAAFLAWYLEARLPAVPPRILRIGFENNPPVQIRTENGFSGLAVEAVSEAARRAGIRMEWRETGFSSEDSIKQRLVDLWPLMTNRPERRKYIHFARPWMH